MIAWNYFCQECSQSCALYQRRCKQCQIAQVQDLIQSALAAEIVLKQQTNFSFVGMHRRLSHDAPNFEERNYDTIQPQPA